MTLARDVAGIAFPNPVLLAAGTAGFGRELAGAMALERLGGLITKEWQSGSPRGGIPRRDVELHRTRQSRS